MVNNSTNINKAIPSHRKSLNIDLKTMTYDVGNAGPGLGQTTNVAESTRLMGSLTS
jgi:hypothetical protein